MMSSNWKFATAAAAGCLALTLTACTAEQTEEARAPEVDVDVDPGNWPEYKVKWADVDVGTRERTVTVPVVRVVQEERQVSVPYIDINPPGARDRAERTISMEVDVPHAGYELNITEIRAAHDDLWVIARLTETGKAATQAKTRVSDHVVINAPEDLDVRKVVIGQRPEGVYNQQFRFVDSMSALTLPQGARTIYQEGAG
jgi:hypothetical protein